MIGASRVQADWLSGTRTGAGNYRVGRFGSQIAQLLVGGQNQLVEYVLGQSSSLVVVVVVARLTRVRNDAGRDRWFDACSGNRLVCCGARDGCRQNTLAARFGEADGCSRIDARSIGGHKLTLVCIVSPEKVVEYYHVGWSVSHGRLCWLSSGEPRMSLTT